MPSSWHSWTWLQKVPIWATRCLRISERSAHEVTAEHHPTSATTAKCPALRTSPPRALCEPDLPCVFTTLPRTEAPRDTPGLRGSLQGTKQSPDLTPSCLILGKPQTLRFPLTRHAIRTALSVLFDGARGQHPHIFPDLLLSSRSSCSHRASSQPRHCLPPSGRALTAISHTLRPNGSLRLSAGTSGRNRANTQQLFHRSSLLRAGCDTSLRGNEEAQSGAEVPQNRSPEGGTALSPHPALVPRFSSAPAEPEPPSLTLQDSHGSGRRPRFRTMSGMARER